MVIRPHRGYGGAALHDRIPLGEYNGKSSEQRDTGSPSVGRGRRMDGEEKRAKGSRLGYNAVWARS